MRSILIDWLIEVHLKFKLLTETLFVTVAIIDRFLERQNVTKAKLQLVGVTALLIASKYEEIYPPEMKDFVFITDKAYTKQDVIHQNPHPHLWHIRHWQISTRHALQTTMHRQIRILRRRQVRSPADG